MKKLLFLVFIFIISMSVGFAQKGTANIKASYYSSKFNGRKTATGATYSDHLYTAASNTFKLGTRLLVTNKRTGKSVKVVVNDRMAPHIRGRVDLSKSAFRQIASLNHGVVPVEVMVLNGKNDEDNLL